MLSLQDAFFLFLTIMINLIGITANSLQLLLGIFKSTENLRVYTVLLVNSSVCDLLACATALFVRPRIIATGKRIFFIPEGNCQRFDGKICHRSYAITLHCYSHSLWSLMVCFIFRYLAIKSVKLDRCHLSGLLILFYLLSFIQLVLFYIGFENCLEIVYELSSIFPDYTFDKNSIFGALDLFDFRLIYITLHMSLLILPIYAIIFWCRLQSLKCLRRHDINMSNRTRMLHRQLLNALSFQAALPAMYLIFLLLFVAAALDLAHSPGLERITSLVVDLVPALSPVVRLYYIRPYKNWIRKNVLRARESKSYTLKGV